VKKPVHCWSFDLSEECGHFLRPFPFKRVKFLASNFLWVRCFFKAAAAETMAVCCVGPNKGELLGRLLQRGLRAVYFI